MASNVSAALGYAPDRTVSASSVTTRLSGGPTSSSASEQCIGGIAASSSDGVLGAPTVSLSSRAEVPPILPRVSHDDGLCTTTPPRATSSADIRLGASPAQSSVPMSDVGGARSTRSSSPDEVVNVIPLASAPADIPHAVAFATVRDANPSAGGSPFIGDDVIRGIPLSSASAHIDTCSTPPATERAKSCVVFTASSERHGVQTSLATPGALPESGRASMPMSMAKTRSFIGFYSSDENLAPLSSLSGLYKKKWRKNLKELPVGICSPYFIFAGASSAALDNDRVVQGDVVRTRAHLAFFRTRTQVLATAITQYCNACKISYRQGFNEIMAPFVILEGEDELRRLVIFHSFFSSYLRPYYVGDFSNLQNVLSLVSTLLLYHCPELAMLLSLAGLEPVCYATPWLLTLFASKLDLPSVFTLWDKYIERDDKTFLPFICVAVLARAEAALLQTEFSSLPEVLSSLTPLPIDEVWEKALVIQTRSPPRFARFVITIFGSDTGEDVAHSLVPSRKSQEVKPAKRRSLHWKDDFAPSGPVALTPQEVLLEYEWHGGLVLLDSRPLKEFEGPTGRLPKAVPVQTAQQAIDVVKASTNRACHFCIIDPVLAAECATDAYGAQVCTVTGGYVALHNLALQEAIELVDHNEQLCFICRPEWVQHAERTAEKASKWISNMRPMRSVKYFASTVTKLGAGTKGALGSKRHSPKKLTATVVLPVINQIGSWCCLLVEREKKGVPCMVVLSEESLYVVAADNRDLNIELLYIILAGPFNLKDVTKITKRPRKNEGSRAFYFRDIDRVEYLGFNLNFELMKEVLDFTKKCQRKIRSVKRQTKRSNSSKDSVSPLASSAMDIALLPSANNAEALSMSSSHNPLDASCTIDSLPSADTMKTPTASPAQNDLGVLREFLDFGEPGSNFDLDARFAFGSCISSPSLDVDNTGNVAALTPTHWELVDTSPSIATQAIGANVNKMRVTVSTCGAAQSIVDGAERSRKTSLTPARLPESDLSPVGNKVSRLSSGAWNSRISMRSFASGSPASSGTRTPRDGPVFLDDRVYPSISASSKLKEGQLLRVLHPCILRTLEDKSDPSNNIVRHLKAGENLVFIQRGADCRLKVESTLDNAVGWVSANHSTGGKLVGAYPKEKKPWPSVMRKVTNSGLL
eukprot:GEMP01006516.1.p1 GENE.GEMP01006516.1~~GEMP01006516.1.p1  ORF type:complete len:1153 (+),score=234.81 GEMP01006516.1:142-3600(+)